MNFVIKIASEQDSEERKIVGTEFTAIVPSGPQGIPSSKKNRDLGTLALRNNRRPKGPKDRLSAASRTQANPSDD
jgi:hypothetical protein